MFKKILDSMAIKANTLQTRAGREYFFGYKSKHNERDRKLKFIAEQKFTEDHPEFMIGHPTGDWDGYVQYRKGYKKSCIFIENHFSVENYYHELLKDKSIDEINYALIHKQDIPEIRNLLTDNYTWENYLDFYRSAFKISYASAWLYWTVDAYDPSIDEEKNLLLRKKSEREKVKNYIFDCIDNKEIPIYSFEEFRKLRYEVQCVYIAKALNVLNLPKLIESFDWQIILAEDIKFAEDYENTYYQHTFWYDIFLKVLHKKTASDDDLETFFNQTG
jgi:hypothetical protein